MQAFHISARTASCKCARVNVASHCCGSGFFITRQWPASEHECTQYSIIPLFSASGGWAKRTKLDEASAFYHPPMARIWLQIRVGFWAARLWSEGLCCIAVKKMLANSWSEQPFLRGPFRSSWWSAKRQGLKWPLAVNLSRLHLLQKCWLRAGINPTSPFAPLNL